MKITCIQYYTSYLWLRQMSNRLKIFNNHINSEYEIDLNYTLCIFVTLLSIVLVAFSPISRKKSETYFNSLFTVTSLDKWSMSIVGSMIDQLWLSHPAINFRGYNETFISFISIFTLL